MEKDGVKAQAFKRVAFVIFLLVISFIMVVYFGKKDATVDKKQVSILVASENKDLEYILQNFAKKNDVKINVTYKEDLYIPKEIAKKDTPYDMVWSANSLSLDINEANPMLKYRKSIAIDPIVIGIKKSKAEQLGFINKNVSMKDILGTVKDKRLKLIMASPTEYISGASAYLSFIKVFCGVEEAIDIEDLQNPKLRQQLKDLFQEVGRAPEGAESLGNIYSKNKYDSIINYEHFLINKNKELVANKEEPLYLIYPNEGVFLADLPFIYLDKKDRNIEEIFKQLQSYLLSEEIQLKLQESGRRIGYGGVMPNINKKIFNPEWGIDTTKQLLVQKYPSKEIIDKALKLCETNLKKPSYIVLCVDSSGLFYEVVIDAKNALKYVFSTDKIQEHHIQFSTEDKINIITFDEKVINIWEDLNPTQAATIDKLEDLPVGGSWGIDTTNIPLVKAYELAAKADINFYSPSIIVIPNDSAKFKQYDDFDKEVKSKGKNIPVYIVNFVGDEFKNPIKNLTIEQVYDGQKGLVQLLQKIK